MANLFFKHVDKIYSGDVHAVKDLNLVIEDKEFVVFVGPSGCGKSTTLRMIAGLEEITSGELYIGDNLVNDMQPKDRDIAMVFQNYALYPHLSVYDNIAFGLKLRKFSKDEIKEKVVRAAKSLGIEELLKRKPRALSGGQKQRVALARAIVRDPEVFLMDEPLSNLDAKLRAQTRSEIIKLHKELQATFIYVTHDQTEAMTMADRIVIMNDGVVQQVDTPHNIYENPTNIFVANFIGNPPMNIILATLKEKPEGLVLKLPTSNIILDKKTTDTLVRLGYINKELYIGTRPENLSIERIEERQSILATVDLVEILGSEKYIHCSGLGSQLVVKTTSIELPDINENIKIGIDIGRLKFFDRETGNAIDTNLLKELR